MYSYLTRFVLCTLLRHWQYDFSQLRDLRALKSSAKVCIHFFNIDALNLNQNTETWESPANLHLYSLHFIIIYLSSPATLPLCPSPFLSALSFPHITALLFHELQLRKAAVCGFYFINDWHLRVLRPQLTYKTCCVTAAGS